MAKLHDGHVGAGVERVEVFPLLLLHAIDRIPFDALHAGLEIPATKTGETDRYLGTRCGFVSGGRISSNLLMEDGGYIENCARASKIRSIYI